jgi:hypothetical protein
MECHGKSQFFDPIHLFVNYLVAATCAEKKQPKIKRNQNFKIVIEKNNNP